MESEKPDLELDARGLICPEPVLRARASLETLDAGQTLKVMATDPHASLDFEVFCARTGHVLLHADNRDGELEFLIRKRPDQSSSA